MPVREPDMVECTHIINGKELNYKIHKQEYEAIERLKKRAPNFNAETQKAVTTIQTILKENALNGTVTTRPFKKLYEGYGLEFNKPRNFLTNEVVEITGIGETKTFYWGEYMDIPGAIEDIIKRVKNNDYERKLSTTQPTVSDGRSNDYRAEPSGTTESGTESFTNISSIRLQFRKR